MKLIYKVLYWSWWCSSYICIIRHTLVYFISTIISRRIISYPRSWSDSNSGCTIVLSGSYQSFILYVLLFYGQKKNKIVLVKISTDSFYLEIWFFFSMAAVIKIWTWLQLLKMQTWIIIKWLTRKFSKWKQYFYIIYILYLF